MRRFLLHGQFRSTPMLNPLRNTTKTHEHFLMLKDLQQLPSQPINQLEQPSHPIHAFQGGSAFSIWSAAHVPLPPLAPHGSLARSLAPLARSGCGWRS
jgi:hypothetical protein